MKKIYIYRHLFPNGKSYIGQTVNPEKRWGGNGNQYSNKTMVSAIMKYGWDNVKHEILAECYSEEEADKCEIAMIEKYNSVVDGYNTSLGGRLGSSTYLNSSILKARYSLNCKFPKNKLIEFIYENRFNKKVCNIWNELDNKILYETGYDVTDDYGSFNYWKIMIKSFWHNEFADFYLKNYGYSKYYTVEDLIDSGDLMYTSKFDNEVFECIVSYLTYYDKTA